MITTANYLLIAYVGGEQYRFEYDSDDVMESLEEFWHEDYQKVLADLKDGCYFPIDIKAMENGKVINTYEYGFNASLFHYYFDHGRITDKEFERSLVEDRKRMITN